MLMMNDRRFPNSRHVQRFVKAPLEVPPSPMNDDDAISSRHQRARADRRGLVVGTQLESRSIQKSLPRRRRPDRHSDIAMPR
jgi:hypothetical protein